MTTVVGVIGTALLVVVSGFAIAGILGERTRLEPHRRAQNGRERAAAQRAVAQELRARADAIDAQVANDAMSSGSGRAFNRQSGGFAA